MSAVDGTPAAKRRRARRLRVPWRHDQQSVSMAVTAAFHNSADRKIIMEVMREQQNEALRRHTTVRAHQYYAPRGQKKGDVEMAQTILQERSLKPLVERMVVDVPATQILLEVVDSVDVLLPQVVEEIVELAQNILQRTTEQFVFEVSAPQHSEEVVEFVEGSQAMGKFVEEIMERIVQVVQFPPLEHVRISLGLDPRVCIQPGHWHTDTI